jgi:hypothetical protein
MEVRVFPSAFQKADGNYKADENVPFSYSLWVIVDQLMKVAHFILVHTCYNVKRYA